MVAEDYPQNNVYIGATATFGATTGTLGQLLARELRLGLWDQEGKPTKASSEVRKLLENPPAVEKPEAITSIASFLQKRQVAMADNRLEAQYCSIRREGQIKKTTDDTDVHG